MGAFLDGWHTGGAAFDPVCWPISCKMGSVGYFSQNWPRSNSNRDLDSMNDFDSLYKKSAADVFRFALYLSGNRADAEDIASETFVRVWASQERIEVETVKGYLFTIARNLFLQGIRQLSRQSPLLDNTPDPFPGADQHLEKKTEFAAVLAAMQGVRSV